MFTLEVKDVIRQNRDTATIRFSASMRSYPGQFVMLYLFGYEEIPLSLSSPDSITVKGVGETTNALLKVKAGDVLGVRGPFGNPFSPSKKALIVAGGIGIAPMAFLYDSLKRFGAEIKVIYGARCGEDLIFRDKFKNTAFFTEDGSFGNSGTVVDGVKEEDLDQYERIYVCGPGGMISELLEVFKREGALSKTEFSLERMMRCGIGVCGSCVLDNGLRVCADGPVFKGDDII